MRKRSISLITFVTIAVAFFFVTTNGHSRPKPSSKGVLVVANQFEHTALIVDPDTRKELAKISVGVNGHEVAVSPDGKFAYVPIYGNSGVGKPGTDGSTIDVIDIANRKLAYSIDLGKPLRPHNPEFGPDGNLYVSAELSQSIDMIDPKTRKIIAELPPARMNRTCSSSAPDRTTRRCTPRTCMRVRSALLIFQAANWSPQFPFRKSCSAFPSNPTACTFSPTIRSRRASSSSIRFPMRSRRRFRCPKPFTPPKLRPDNHWLICAGMKGHIFVVDLHTRKLVKTFDAPTTLGKVLIRPDGGVAYISFLAAGKIEVLDLKNWKLQPSIDLTPGVDGMDWAPIS